MVIISIPCSFCKVLGGYFCINCDRCLCGGCVNCIEVTDYLSTNNPETKMYRCSECDGKEFEIEEIHD
jgi:hypothetical protein